MGLKTYQAKRNLTKTPEPDAKIPHKKSNSLRFCVQKHAASHLHYDFRLENNGVLLSWAVPKGPSMNPSDKRLAIQVEDHPYDYRNFEGVIPEGNYGAGIVMLWDEGTYRVPGAQSTKEMEKLVSQGIRDGHLEFELQGEKLKGLFALIKLKQSEGNWLLIKKNDDTATSKDITRQDHSVRSDRSLEQIGEDGGLDPSQIKKRKSETAKTAKVKSITKKKIPQK